MGGFAPAWVEPKAKIVSPPPSPSTSQIPLFRSLGKIKFVVMDGVSSDVVKLIVGMVYGHDR